MESSTSAVRARLVSTPSARPRACSAPRSLQQSPEAAGWRAGYARVARDVPGRPDRDLDAALATVRRFLGPVLYGTASGTWDTRDLRWWG